MKRIFKVLTIVEVDTEKFEYHQMEQAGILPENIYQYDKTEFAFTEGDLACYIQEKINHGNEIDGTTDFISASSPMIEEIK